MNEDNPSDTKRPFWIGFNRSTHTSFDRKMIWTAWLQELYSKKYATFWWWYPASLATAGQVGMPTDYENPEEIINQEGFRSPCSTGCVSPQLLPFLQLMPWDYISCNCLVIYICTYTDIYSIYLYGNRSVNYVQPVLTVKGDTCVSPRTPGHDLLSWALPLWRCWCKPLRQRWWKTSWEPRLRWGWSEVTLSTYGP